MTGVPKCRVSHKVASYASFLVSKMVALVQYRLQSLILSPSRQPQVRRGQDSLLPISTAETPFVPLDDTSTSSRSNSARDRLANSNDNDGLSSIVSLVVEH